MRRHGAYSPSGSRCCVNGVVSPDSSIALPTDETGAWTAAKRALLLRPAQAGVSRSAVRVPAGRPKWASRVAFVARHRYVIADKYRPGRETATRSTVAQAANIWLYVAELRRSQNCKDVLARELARARRILALANQKYGLQVKDSKTVVRLIGVPRVRISPPPFSPGVRSLFETRSGSTLADPHPAVVGQGLAAALRS